ncbi:MAG: PAS domain S-box protein [Ignavibacteriales bacterium]
MEAKVDKTPKTNSTPVMSIDKNGCIVYSNEAGNLLLDEWDMKIGEKLPSYIVDLVQRVISHNSPEKTEIKVGVKVYLIVFHPSPEEECIKVSGFDISEQKELEEELQESEDLEMPNLELSEIFDTHAIQSLMDDFYKLSHIPLSLDDINGKTLVGVGWQDICTKFHRVHPDTCKQCFESNKILSSVISPGEIKQYKCMNNMWDIATPIIVDDKHIGNIFAGQFFYEDEPIDYEYFRSNARRYGFNEEEYIEALEKVPRLSRDAVNNCISFLMNLANMISQLSYGNIKLIQSLVKSDTLLEALRESEEKNRNFIETANEGIVILNDESMITYVNEKMAMMLKCTKDEIIGKSLRDFTDEDGKIIFEQKMKKRRQGIDESHEFKFISKDGSPLWTLVNSKSLFDKNGQFIGSFSMNTDITERKQEEHRICRYNRILEGINWIFSNVMQAKTEEELGEVCLSVALEITGSEFGFINKMGDNGLLHDVAKSQLGWERCLMENKTEHRRPLSEFIVHGLYGSVIINEKGFFTNNPQSHPNSIGLPEGHPPLTSFLGVPLVQDGKTIGVIAVANREGGYSYEQQEDLEVIAPAVMQALQRKKAEEALKEAHCTLEERVKERTAELEYAYNSLKESKRSLAEAQEMAHIGNWEWDIATDKAYWSEEMYRIFGRDPQKLAPSLEEYYSYIHPNDLDYYCKVNDYTKKVPTSGLDFRIVLANGEERTLHIKSDFIFDDENNPIRVKGIVQDITESKKAEEEIQNLANIVESSSDAIGTLSLDGIITSWNKGAEQIYGYSVEEVLGKSVSILAPLSLHDETKKLTDMVIQGEKVHQYETLRERKDGKIIYVSIALSPVFDNYGKLTAISFIVRDITKRKEAEEALAKIEIARKQEIHHRIKNNLQVISSLLDLQTEKFKGKKNIEDSQVLEAFKESQDRVISMALIHEELHKGGEIDTLNFSHYIEELSDNLVLSYRLGNEDISLVMDVEEDIFFDMDTSVPLGMIINELLSNSLKHAFKGRNKGEIRIKLHRDENGKCESEDCNLSYVLSVSDNGIGIPEDIDIEDIDSLGLQLVTTLVDQLDGELELKRDNGTEFIIRFTVTEKNE